MTDTEIRMKIETIEGRKVEIPTREYIELIQLIKDLRWEVFTRDQDIDKLKNQIAELEQSQKESDTE